LILSAFLLAACGNIDQGKASRLASAATDSANLVATVPSSGQSFGNCKAMSIYAGTDPAFSKNFGGTTACASTTQLNLVKLKTSAYFPTSTRVCLVPLSFQGAFDATCFVVNGQVEIALTTEQFTSVALVRESDLGAYVTYITGKSASYPAMAFASLR